MTTPNDVGIYRFKGIRYTTRRGFMVSVNDICEVKDMTIGFSKERVAVFLGRSTPYSLKLFEGEWATVDVGIIGERCS
jgi:hypothetical protein